MIRGTASVAAVIGLLLAWTQPTAADAVDAVAATPPLCAGAAALVSGCPVDEHGPVLPMPAFAERDSDGNGKDEDCWSTDDFTEFRTCTFGKPTARYTVALVGNSHAAHFLGPLREWADRVDARVITYLIPKCFATTERIAFRSDPALTDRCENWGKWVQAETNDLAPDLIVTAERTYLRPERKAPESNAEIWKQGYAQYLKGWTDQGRRILVIRDSPVPHDPVPECLARNPLRYSACAGERDAWLPPDPLVEAALEADPAIVSVADLSQYMCTATQCPATIGKILVYRDGSHMSATWIRALAPYLEETFREALTSP